jgi:tetratricopeptide (TPR) repeat protein
MLKHVVLVVLFAGMLLPEQVFGQQLFKHIVPTEPVKYAIPLCPLTLRGNLRDAQNKLRDGHEENDAEKRAKALDESMQMTLGAITTDPGSPAADCDIDTGQYRQNAWIQLANEGIKKQQEGDNDSTLILLRAASQIFRGLPHVFENMGILFANNGMVDSAAYYFRQALDVSRGDSTLITNRNSSALNLALMNQRLGRHDEAIATLREFLSWNVNDTDARRSLAYSFREAGMVDSADVIEQSLVSEFASMDLDSLSFIDLMAVGVTQFNAEKYDQAAMIFTKLMERNPWSRDAVYNLANALLALKDQERLTEVSKRLTEIEPLNEDAYRLLGQGYRDRSQDSLVATAEALVGLPVHVEITGFQIGSTSRINGVATGREANDPTGAIKPPAALTLVFEFLDENGGVVSSQEVEVPALNPTQEFALHAEASNPSIVSWRYRRK